MARRGFMVQLWNNLKQTVTIAKRTEIFVGSDEFGNKYYEKPADQSKRLKQIRRVEPADGDEFSNPQTPVEWTAWLRNRRKDPPTPEEIQRNYIKMLRTQQRVKELELKEINSRIEIEGENTFLPETKSKAGHPVGGAFPQYDEFEIAPGELQEKEPRAK